FYPAIFHSGKAQLPHRKNKPILPAVYSHTLSNSSQPPRRAIPICSMIVSLGSKENLALVALQKRIIGFPSRAHRDKKIGDVSIHRCLCRRNRRGSRDKNFVSANNLSSQCSLPRYNQKPSTQNRRSQMDCQQL